MRKIGWVIGYRRMGRLPQSVNLGGFVRPRRAKPVRVRFRARRRR